MACSCSIRGPWSSATSRMGGVQSGPRTASRSPSSARPRPRQAASRSSRSGRVPCASYGSSSAPTPRSMRPWPGRPTAAGSWPRRTRPTGKRFVRIDAATGDVVDIAPMYHLADPGAHWSPDSRRFAYARPDDCGGSPPCQSSIVIEDADLTNAVAITDPTKLARGPVWSPDGDDAGASRARIRGMCQRERPVSRVLSRGLRPRRRSSISTAGHPTAHAADPRAGQRASPPGEPGLRPPIWPCSG